MSQAQFNYCDDCFYYDKFTVMQVKWKKRSPYSSADEILYTLDMRGIYASKRVITQTKKWLTENYTGVWMYQNKGFGNNSVFCFFDPSILTNTDLKELIDHEAVIERLSI